jgi:hypothetical protein
MDALIYVCDEMRHLACLPYSVENLHKMAQQLGIKRCWYHSSSKYPHYDIPKRRISEIIARCRVVTPRQMLGIIKGEITEL